MFDGVQPTAVIVVASAEDVGRVIAYARANNVAFAVRSGGHAYAGWSTGTGLVIDTRGLAGVGALAADGTAAIGAGTQLIDVYSTFAAQGVAVSGGSCATVGFSGLALGGGHGFTSRAYGLACDAVVAMEVVTADGVVHQCDENNDADLFWACRGGGGSFGVVTKMIVRPHPIPPVATTFELTYSWHNAGDALARWMQWVPSLPGATMTGARLQKAQSLQLVVLGLHLGPVAEAKQVLAPILAGAASSSIASRPFVDALMLEAGCTHRTLTACHNSGISAGGTLPRQTPFVASSHYFGTPLSSDAIAAAMSAVQHRAAHADTATMQFDSYGGAIAGIANDATAFVHRNAFCSAQYGSYFTSGDGSDDRAWIRSTRAAMGPFSNGEAYQNYVDPELDGWAQAYYGANLARLQSVKRAVDPDNVFTFPQSIPLT